MTQTRLLLALFALLVFTNTLFGQDFFQKTYDLEFKDSGQGVEVLPNGDIVVAGVPYFSSRQMWVQRLNGKGEVLWSKQFSENPETAARDIQKTTDGHLWVLYTSGANNGIRSNWMKITTSGDVLFSRRTSIGCVLEHIFPLFSGGYLLTGYDLNTVAIALKINEDGSIAWVSRMGSIESSIYRHCWEDVEGFVYCAGTYYHSNGNRDGLLTKISPAGAVLWARRYGGTSPSQDELVEVAPFDGDSSLLLAGYSPGFGGDKVWLTKITLTGTVKWSRTYSLPDNEDLATVDVLKLPGNEYLISAAKPDYEIGRAAILFKVTQDGDILWAYEYKSGAEHSIFREVLPVQGGFVAAGSSTLNGDEDIYIVKTNLDGLIPGSDCCPAPTTLTVKDVFPETMPFTSGTQGGFSALNTQVTASNVVPEVTNICTPIDLEFTLSDSTLCPKECVEITLVGNTPDVTYSLEIHGGEADPLQPGRICHTDGPTLFVTRKGANGLCGKALTKALRTDNKADAFPNAFTPNGDGINDTFKPVFSCPVITANFKIYNRWGQKVFETQDPNEAWNGKVDGTDAPSDVYAWQLEYEAEREGSRQKWMEKGDVALLR